MTTPQLCCKICGIIDDYNSLPNNICQECYELYKNVSNIKWIKPSEKVWLMIEKDYMNHRSKRWICEFYGISRNTLYVHMKNYNPNKIIVENKQVNKSFWIKLKELFK